MLVRDTPQGPPNVFTVAAADGGFDVRSEYESFMCCVNRIIRRDTERLLFAPNKLSAAVIGAFMAIGGQVAHCVEASYAQWHQFVVGAVRAASQRSRTASTQPMVATPSSAIRRVKAFFVAQKVDARNAP
jgi:hypothetical protein